MRVNAHYGLLLCALAVPFGAAWAQDVMPPPPEASPEAQPQWTPEEHAVVELLRSLRKRERPSDAELGERLSKAGERVLPLLFEVLATRQVPGLPPGDAAPSGAESSAAKPRDPAQGMAAPSTGASLEPQILSEVQEQAVLLAIAQLEREAVLAHVGVALAAHSDPKRRHATISCIGAVGRANDLPQLFELAFGGDEKVPEERLMRALRRAVATLLSHDPRGFEQLASLRRITRAELLAELVKAVGATRDPRGLAYLSEIAYWHEDLVPDVMSQVPLLGPSGDELIDGAMKVRLRPYLDETNPGPARSAITALIALGDQEAIAPLIGLLDGENTGLSQTAHWGLKQLTGLTLSPEPEVWSRWHQAELFWLVRQKPKEFQRLRESDPGLVADALRTILTHPLARHELSSALPDLLKSRTPALRVLACRTLSDLEAKEAVGRLVWALEDSEPEVAMAAHAALQRLTKLELPREPYAWQAATHTAPRGAEL